MGADKAVAGSGVDGFRLPAAFLVVAIHIGPLACWSQDLDFLFSYCLARLAVPFFLMTTGFFMLGPWYASLDGPASRQRLRLRRFLRKTLLTYGAAVLLYLPLQAYAGNLPNSLGEALRQLLADGTFYHLWYFPAVLAGCLLLIFLLPRLGMGKTGILAFLLYLIGLLGDSWYGLAGKLPALKAFYQGVFTLSTYTRNGLFYTPLFLYLGILAAETHRRPGRFGAASLVRPSTPGAARCTRVPIPWFPVLGLAISLVFLLMEGWFTYAQGWQRHNSMYLSLFPASWFLFSLLLKGKGRDLRILRPLSLLVYLIHPLGIVLIRGGARVLGLWTLLVENTLLHWLSVCLLSLGLAAGIVWVQKRLIWQRKERKTQP